MAVDKCNDDDIDKVVHASETNVDDDDDINYYHHIDTQREHKSPVSTCEDLSHDASQAQVIVLESTASMGYNKKILQYAVVAEFGRPAIKNSCGLLDRIRKAGLINTCRRHLALIVQ